VQEASIKSSFSFSAVVDVLDYSINSFFKLDTKRNLSHPKLLAKAVMIDTGKSIVVAPVGIAAGSSSAIVVEAGVSLLFPELAIPAAVLFGYTSSVYTSSVLSDEIEKTVTYRYR
jgi:hypothetical protein